MSKGRELFSPAISSPRVFGCGEWRFPAMAAAECSLHTLVLHFYSSCNAMKQPLTMTRTSGNKQRQGGTERSAVIHTCIAHRKAAGQGQRKPLSASPAFPFLFRIATMTHCFPYTLESTREWRECSMFPWMSPLSFCQMMACPHGLKSRKGMLDALCS